MHSGPIFVLDLARVFLQYKVVDFFISREQAISLLPREEPASRLFCSALMTFPNRALPKKSSTYRICYWEDTSRK